jgi:hypothetical protein
VLVLRCVVCVQIADKYPAEFEARKKDKLRYRYVWGTARASGVCEHSGWIVAECLLPVASTLLARPCYACYPYRSLARCCMCASA